MTLGQSSRLLAISIDLDSARLYRRIHGLPEQERHPDQQGLGAGFLLSATRCALELARDLHLVWTFFVVTEDLADPGLVSLLSRALEEGHAVESHSRTHPYDLVHKTIAELDAEITGSFDDLESALGVRPAGFRAPGYSLSESVLRAVVRAGGRFDASLLASPPYALAKLAAIGLHAARGRRSGGLATPRRELLMNPAPHRAPFGVDGLTEIPITVTRTLRLPVLGTFLLRSPTVGRALLRGADHASVLSLAFHALDLVGKDEPSAEPFSVFEPSLFTALPARLSTFRELLGPVARARRSVALRNLTPSR